MKFTFHNNNGSDKFAGQTFKAIPVIWDPQINGWKKTTNKTDGWVWGVFGPDGIGPIGQPEIKFGIFHK